MSFRVCVWNNLQQAEVKVGVISGAQTDYTILPGGTDKEFQKPPDSKVQILPGKTFVGTGDGWWIEFSAEGLNQFKPGPGGIIESITTRYDEEGEKLIRIILSGRTNSWELLIDNPPTPTPEPLSDNGSIEATESDGDETDGSGKVNVRIGED